MKKTISMLLVCVLLVCSLTTLVSCGKMFSGKYEADLVLAHVTYEFEFGGKVTKTSDPFIGNNEVTEGKYEINDDETKITFTFGDESYTVPFAKGEESGVKYIKLDGIKYTVAE